MRNDKTVYVIGHKNPDTDSVVAAAAYAALKQAQGMENCYAARAGKVTPQTEYVFNRFRVPLPEFIPDLIPRVDYYDNHDVQAVAANSSLWDAMETMQRHQIQALPVVDEHGRYHSLLHYGFIAEMLLHVSNPNTKTAIQTSVALMASVLRAQALVACNEDEIRKSPIIVASAKFDTFAQILATHVPANTIVISGDRANVHRHAIEQGVRVLITTNGDLIDRDLKELARENGVSVLSSPFDTSSTTRLLIYAMPLGGMAMAGGVTTTKINPVNRRDPVRRVASLLSDAPGKSLPVVNDAGLVVGILSESDIYREPNIELILVDHNEFSQAIEGAEHYRLLEVVDHHRLGSLSTKSPIAFINKPVGATCTIIAEMYQESRVPLGQEMASLLLAGILADTLVLQSATTTEHDRAMAEFLANIANHDIPALGRDLVAAASRIAGRGAEELVRQDMKEYTEQEAVFTVSQIEVANLNEALDRKREFLDVLEAERKKGGRLFSALLVTDITILSSLLMIAADGKFLPFIRYPKAAEGVYGMGDIVSRKKQLMPVISELLEKFRAEG